MNESIRQAVSNGLGNKLLLVVVGALLGAMAQSVWDDRTIIAKLDAMAAVQIQIAVHEERLDNIEAELER